MSEASDLFGLSIRPKTFSLVVSDINGDDQDDILIGAHEKNPYLFVNSGRGFTAQSQALFAQGLKSDRHGDTVADLDIVPLTDILEASKFWRPDIL